jgi:DNA primase
MSKGNVEKIKERLDIVDLLSSYLKLEKSGANYKARCPFHNEKTASFYVSVERQSFYCFGCQAKGDIFTFVERFEGLDFKGSLKQLADRAGVTLEFSNKESKEEKDERDRLFDVLEAATEFFTKNLANDKGAREYIDKRGINEKSIDQWRIGLAQAEWRSLHDELLAKGFKKDEMLKAGLIKKTDDGKYYDTFRARVMFPIFDTAGRVIAFSGRILVDDPKAPKYLNSPETELFKKSEVLYGLNFAKSEMRRLEYTILVEGQMDLVMAHQAGTRNTVASSGTAFTAQHLEKLKKLAGKILIAYDSDEAGRKATRRVGEMALGLGLEVKVADMPEGEDPASLILSSCEDWKNVLSKAFDLVSFLTKQAVKNSAGKEIRLAKELSDNVLPAIALVESEMLRSQYVSVVAKMTKIPEASIWADLKKISKSKTITDSKVTDYEIAREEEMLAGLILWRESVDSRQETLDRRRRLEEILGTKVEDIIEGKDRDALLFQSEIRWSGVDVEKTFNEILGRLQKRYLEKRLKNLAEKMDKVNGGEKEELKKELEEISKQLSKI